MKLVEEKSIYVSKSTNLQIYKCDINNTRLRMHNGNVINPTNNYRNVHQRLTRGLRIPKGNLDTEIDRGGFH